MNYLFQRFINEGYTALEAETLIAELEEHHRQNRMDREGEMRYNPENKKETP